MARTSDEMTGPAPEAGVASCAATGQVVVDADALGRVGTALADETRRRLLLALLGGPEYPSGLADRLGLSRGNVSNHLACLRGCGLVTTRAEGRRVVYELADPRLAAALAELASLVLVVSAGVSEQDRCEPDDYTASSIAEVGMDAEIGALGVVTGG